MKSKSHKTKPQTDTDDLFATTEHTEGTEKKTKSVIISENSPSKTKSNDDSVCSVHATTELCEGGCSVVKKSSGIPWLGDIPEHWEVMPIKRVVTIPVTDGPHSTPEILDDGIPFISAEAVGNNKIDFSKKRGYISLENHREYCQKYKPLRDDIYMIKSGATTGNLGIVETDEEFNIWSPLAVIRTDMKMALPRYILSVMNSKEFQTSVQLFWSFGTQQNIGMNVIENLKIPLPPIPEQKAIAEYLDRKTGRIDSLISKKEKLVELLKEKRSALISHTVTKGINPKARLKSSGVDWLGDIPEHWKMNKLSHLTRKIGSGKTPLGGAEVYQSEGIIFIRSQNVYDDGLRLDDVVYIDDEMDQDQSFSRVKPSDILLNITGASLGRTCIVPNDFTAANVNQHVCIIRLNDTNFAKFISLFLKSKMAKSSYDFSQTGSAREGLNFEQIGSLKIPIPPLSEQKAIAEYLDRETGKIDSLISHVESAIGKLKEYRSAVISAAVTGKIATTEHTEYTEN